jgi:hypothetical protein
MLTKTAFAAVRNMGDGERIAEISDSFILLEKEIEENNRLCGWEHDAPVLRIVEVHIAEMHRVSSTGDKRRQMKRLKAVPTHPLDSEAGIEWEDSAGVWRYDTR